jgi:hypothetical protein
VVIEKKMLVIFFVVLVLMLASSGSGCTCRNRSCCPKSYSCTDGKMGMNCCPPSSPVLCPGGDNGATKNGCCPKNTFCCGNHCCKVGVRSSDNDLDRIEQFESYIPADHM